MVYVDVCMSTLSRQLVWVAIFFDGRGRGQLVKMLITFEPDGIFGMNCAYLFI